MDGEADAFELRRVLDESRNDPALREALRGLMPWRKGPYRIADVYIDTEWRSDFKWDRIQPWLAPLAGRRVLDVGCGFIKMWTNIVERR